MTSPLPRRIAWFAPWTWKRRWWVTIVLALMIYHLSWPVTLFVLWKLEVAFPNSGIMPTGVTVCRIIYAPIFVIAQNCPPYEYLIDLELGVLKYLFGDPLKNARAVR